MSKDYINIASICELIIKTKPKFVKRPNDKWLNGYERAKQDILEKIRDDYDKEIF